MQFRHVPGNLYRGKIMGDLDSTTNELVSADAILNGGQPKISGCTCSVSAALQ